MADKAPAKKKAVSKGQAMKVADFMKSQGSPAVATPASSPMTTDDDNDGE